MGQLFRRACSAIREAIPVSSLPAGGRAECMLLEGRRLLAVTAGEYATIRETYSDFGLPADMAQIDVIEIMPDQLSVATLKGAITTAWKTSLPDLVVVRTTETQNSIVYTSSTDRLIASAKNAISIVSFGSRPLTLDAAGKCTAIVASSTSLDVVNLGGLIVKGGSTGIAQTYGTVRLQNMTISENLGTGLSQRSGNLSLRGVVISGNAGSGFEQLQGTASFTDVTITDNHGFDGGGIAQYGGTLHLSNVTISNNMASYEGGGIWTSHATISMENVTISGNRAGGGGGGIFLDFAIATITNAVISGNEASSGGGGAQHEGSISTYTNVTVAGNVGGGVISTGMGWDRITLSNSVFAMNGDNHYDVASDGLSAANTIIGYGFGVTNGQHGNIVGTWNNRIDPVFVNMTGADWTQWDLRLAPTSPGINSGSNALVPTGITTDLAGIARIQDGTVDMGAYELEACPRVLSSAVNDGGAQRSTVKKVSVMFSEPVDIAAGAVDVRMRTGAAVPNVTVTLTPSADHMTWQLAFAGDAVTDDSLPDGIYRLIATAADVHDTGGNPMALDYTAAFHRLFGDADGDRDVDKEDLALFRQALNRPANYETYCYFDFDADGVVNASDYLELKARMSRSVLK